LNRPSLRRRLGPLDERPFRLLWIGRTVSDAGDALVPLAIAFAVLDLTGSAADLGLVLAALFASRVVFIVVGGVWSDRLPRQLVMIGADLVRAAMHASVALLFFADAVQVWYLIVSAAVFGAASAFFGPASTGLVKSIVRPERLQEANALLGISRSTVAVFGPAIAGLLVASVGFGIVFAIDAATFLVSAGFLVAMRLPRHPIVSESRSFLADLAGGVGEVRRRTWLCAAFVAFAVGNLSMAAYLVLGPLVVETELGGPKDWGLILTAGAVGGVVGSAVALRWRPERSLLPAFGLMLSVSVLLVALVPPLPVAVLAVLAAVTFASIAVGNVLWNTMLQQHVPRETISRVSSLDWMVSLVFMPLGYTVAGPLAEGIGLDTTLFLAAGLGAAANIGVLLVPGVRGLRRLERRRAPSSTAPPVPRPALLPRRSRRRSCPSGPGAGCPMAMSCPSGPGCRTRGTRSARRTACSRSRPRAPAAPRRPPRRRRRG
jgi:MFS family permease